MTYKIADRQKLLNGNERRRRLYTKLGSPAAMHLSVKAQSWWARCSRLLRQLQALMQALLFGPIQGCIILHDCLSTIKGKARHGICYWYKQHCMLQIQVKLGL